MRRMSLRRCTFTVATFLVSLAAFSPETGAQELGSLVIQVVDGDGIGVADAEVRIVDMGRRALPEEPRADGWYAFGELPPGSYLVEATSLRFGRAAPCARGLSARAKTASSPPITPTRWPSPLSGPCSRARL